MQRVSRAKVSYVSGECLISREIDGGYVVLVGCCENDTEEDIEWLVGKIVNLRVMDSRLQMVVNALNILRVRVLLIKRL